MIKLANLKKLVCCLGVMFIAAVSLSAQTRVGTFNFQGSLYHASTQKTLPIHMTLTFYSNNTVEGYYTYDRIVAQGSYDTLPLGGTYSGDIDDSQIVLIEYDVDGIKALGTFTCKLSGSYGWDGNLTAHYLNITGRQGYRNHKSGKVYQVNLNAVNFSRR